VIIAPGGKNKRQNVERKSKKHYEGNAKRDEALHEYSGIIKGKYILLRCTDIPAAIKHERRETTSDTRTGTGYSRASTK
jgi:hypothetical protein